MFSSAVGIKERPMISVEVLQYLTVAAWNHTISTPKSTAF